MTGLQIRQESNGLTCIRNVYREVDREILHIALICEGSEYEYTHTHTHNLRNGIFASFGEDL
jgi:hypothetical protein